jgi:hypothetical protein
MAMMLDSNGYDVIEHLGRVLEGFGEAGSEKDK